MNQKKVLRIAAIFFAGMVCFTLLSRAADQAGIAVVTVARPENRMITHQVTASGKVIQNRELAVTVEAGQRVTSIAVSEGERVEKGDLLFAVDQGLLEELLLEQKQEIQRQELSIQDADSQREVSSRQKANEQAQAAENYALSVSRAQAQLSRAEGELSRVRQELKEFRESGGTVSYDRSAEETLEAACEEKTADYIQAVEELDALEWEIEKAVDKALQNAAGAELQAADTVKRQSSGEAAGEIHLEEAASEPAGKAGDCSDASSGGSGAGQDFFSEGSGAGQDFSSEGSGAGQDVAGSPGTADTGGFIDSVDVVSGSDMASDDMVSDKGESIPASEPDEDSGDSVFSLEPDEDSGESVFSLEPDEDSGDSIFFLEPDGEGSSADSSVPTENLYLDGNSDENSSFDTGEADGSSGAEERNSGNLGGSEAGKASGSAAGAAPSQADLAEIERSVRDSYADAWKAAEQKVEEARAQKTAAEDALSQYQQERLAASDSQAAETEEQLIAAVRTAQESYQDAAIAANEAAVTGGRQIASAGIPNPSDSSVERAEITLEQMELKLAKLEELQAAKGRIYAPAQGLVLRVNIAVGEKTGDTAAILLADLAEGCRFTAELSEEQEQYIGVGDLVTLTGSGKQKLEGQAVESLAADEENKECYHITVPLSEGSFEVGARVTMEFTQKTDPYAICVPLSALHLDQNNQAYVLVPEEQDSVMGTETVARRRNVTVLEKNETYTALAEGMISSQDEVIVHADRTIDEGSRVRVSD